jgi:regulatory protein YycH of two-component signal transduction system YycFG
MREQIYKALMLRYQADMEEALLKIDYLMNSAQPVIVEHTDITGEVDKLLHIVADAKENMAILRQYYGTN